MIAFVTCGAANAQLTTISFGPFTVNCSSGVQLCNNVFSQPVPAISQLRVQYVASALHCSNVRAHILVDGVEKGLTAFLTPGQASGFFDVGPVTAGSHIVALQGEGTVGGCNVGVLLNWGGRLDVMTDALVAAEPIPAGDARMLILLAAMLVVAGGFALRRYSGHRR